MGFHVAAAFGDGVVIDAPQNLGTAGQFLTSDGLGGSSWTSVPSLGTVTTVSVTTANGVSGSVSNATTTPAITLTLGDITPTSVAASGTVTGSNLSGTNTGNQTTSNSDGTITVATGSANPVVSLALGHANSWTAAQSFTAGMVATAPSLSYTFLKNQAGTAILSTDANDNPQLKCGSSSSRFYFDSGSSPRIDSGSFSVLGINGGQVFLLGSDSTSFITFNASGRPSIINGLVIDSPTGGWKGASTINVGTIYQNGTALGSLALLSAVSLTANVSGILPLANGGTGADLSATGGTSRVLRQSTTGGVVTVSQLANSDITGLGTASTYDIGTSGTNKVPILDANNTWSGTVTISTSGAASTPAVTYSGTPFSGGTTTTNFPMIYTTWGSPSASVSTWSASGTVFGGNIPTFAGNLYDYRLNGSSTPFFQVNTSGMVISSAIVFGNGQGNISRQAGFGGVSFNSDNSIDVGAGPGFRLTGSTFKIGITDSASPLAGLIQHYSVIAGTSNGSANSLTIQQGLSTGTGTAGTLIHTASFSGVTTTNTVTVTIATPGVFTLASHGFVPGSSFRLTTNGALPTGLATGTTYYVLATNLSANTFQASATPGGSSINTTGSQSGTHTLTSQVNVQNAASAIATWGPSGLTGSQSISLFSISQTWNTSGTPTLILANAIDIASNASSLLMDLQVSGVSKACITKGGAATFAGNLTLSAVNIVTDTTTGMKIGTSTTQKLSVFNATPVVQQTGDIAVALTTYGWVTSPTLAASYLTSATLAAGVGFSVTSYNGSTVSSGTYTPATSNGNMQYYTNGGAHTLAPPSTECTVVIEILNNGSAGAITTSGFTKVAGDSFTTTNTHKFHVCIIKSKNYSSLVVTALQ